MKNIIKLSKQDHKIVEESVKKIAKENRIESVEEVSIKLSKDSGLVKFSMDELHAKKKGKTIEDYEAEGYEGSDASLEISLFEYGLIWKDRRPEGYHFIYGTSMDSNGYNKFDSGWITSDRDFDWIDLKDVLSYTGLSEEEWAKLPLPNKVSDVFNYYGHENVFGSSYGGGFSVVNNDSLDEENDSLDEEPEEGAKKFTYEDSEEVTEEVRLWLLNDEYLYNQVIRLARRSYSLENLAKRMKEELSEDILQYVKGINIKNIDWDDLASNFEDEMSND